MFYKFIVSSKQTIAWHVLCFLCLLTAVTFAVEDSNEMQDIFDMSLEELMDVEIVSGSRQLQKVEELSIPVSVITAEDIHYSGLTTIPEILQLAPGVDVRRLDRYRYIVGVRGMTGLVSDRTLVLINGRTAMNSVLGPPDWLNLPVLVEDIDHIEVLRGPTGSAWGANAVTGIINIITKKPDAQLGSLFSTTISEYGDMYNHLRYARAKDDWSWRISAGYEDVRNSDAAGSGQTESAFPALNGPPPFGMNFASFTARDFVRISRFDSEFRRQYSPDTALLFGAAYSYAQAGDKEFIGYYPFKNNRTNTLRLFTRLEHIYDDSTTGYIQWFGNIVDAHVPQMNDSYNYFENDLEAQINFTPQEEHSFSVGGNLRWLRFNYDRDPGDAVTFACSECDEYWAGLFMIDRFKLSQKLSLETQGRVDWYSETQTDWSLRTTALYSLDDENHHVLRAGFARSFRAANLLLREGRSSTLAGLFKVVAPPRGLDNERTDAFEAGYTGKLSQSLIFRLNSYYQRVDDILGVVSTMMGPFTNSSVQNLDGADTYGAECELTYKKDKFEVTGWYAWNRFEFDPPGQAMRAQVPADNKAGLRSRFFLNRDWALNANYTYNDSVANLNTFSPPKASDPFHRLDLTLSHPFKDNRGEIMFGVADVLNKTQTYNYDVSNFTSYETPGRTFFARLQLYF